VASEAETAEAAVLLAVIRRDEEVDAIAVTVVAETMAVPKN
jgi:hypothetical protein